MTENIQAVNTYRYSRNNRDYDKFRHVEVEQTEENNPKQWRLNREWLAFQKQHEYKKIREDTRTNL